MGGTLHLQQLLGNRVLKQANVSLFGGVPGFLLCSLDILTSSFLSKSFLRNSSHASPMWKLKCLSLRRLTMRWGCFCMFKTDRIQADILLSREKWTMTRRNGLNIIPWSKAMRVATLARNLPRPIDCRSPNTHQRSSGLP